MLNIFKRKSARSDTTVNKFLNYKDVLSYPFSDGANNRPYLTNITPTTALSYYACISPVAINANRIVDEVGNITPLIVRNDDNTTIPNTPVIALINHPSMNKIGTEFIKEVGLFYEITGNAYVIATGDIERPPLELHSINPTRVTIDENSYGRPPDSYHLDNGKVFKYRIIGGQGRYVSDDNSMELWHIREVNPQYDSYQGFSRLTSVQSEILQYFHASTYNKSLLEQGAAIKGFFTLNAPSGSISQEQRDSIERELSMFYKGSKNAGKVGFTVGDLGFKEIGKSNKDMEFAVLKDEAARRIGEIFKVPQPLVDSKVMTLNNMENSILLLYDNAVLPLVTRIYEELQQLLFPRYGIDPNIFTLTYNEDDITALQPRRNDQLLKNVQLNVLTINDVRKEISFDPLPGGDDVYLNGALLPLSSFTDTLPASSSDTNISKAFIDGLQNMKDPDGSALFSDEEVDEMTKKMQMIDNDEYNSKV